MGRRITDAAHLSLTRKKSCVIQHIVIYTHSYHIGQGLTSRLSDSVVGYLVGCRLLGKGYISRIIIYLRGWDSRISFGRSWVRNEFLPSNRSQTQNVEFRTLVIGQVSQQAKHDSRVVSVLSIALSIVSWISIL